MQGDAAGHSGDTADSRAGRCDAATGTVSTTERTSSIADDQRHVTGRQANASRHSHSSRTSLLTY